MASQKILVNHSSFFVDIRATVEKFVNITQRLAGIMPGRKQTLRGVKKRFGEALPILKTNLTRSTLNEKRTELKNTTKEGDRGYLKKFWRNTCLELSAPVEKGHLKRIHHTEGDIAFRYSISPGFT